jgi:hypothetical protein
MQIKRFKGYLEEMNEDVAVNSAGGGAIAGLGVGPAGEPGIKKKPKMLRRKKLYTEDKEDGNITFGIPVVIRMLEIAREALKSDDELHVFVEKLMDLNVKGPLTMKDVEKVFAEYRD